KSIYPYILITSNPTVLYFPTIPRIVVMLVIVAILRHPAIPRIVALDGMVHHVT
ncbi:hypothetical protein COCC4DRAFT_118157, partial [Bipolaris maydis ATCC 48331]